MKYAFQQFLAYKKHKRYNISTWFATRYATWYATSSCS